MAVGSSCLKGEEIERGAKENGYVVRMLTGSCPHGVDGWGSLLVGDEIKHGCFHGVDAVDESLVCVGFKAEVAVWNLWCARQTCSPRE